MAQDRSRVAVAATAAVVVVGYLARTIAKLLEENSELKLRLANESTGDKPAELAPPEKKEEAKAPEVEKEEAKPKKKRGWGSVRASITHAPSGGALAKANSQRAGEPELKAAGEVRGVNGFNQALWALGAFKHEPPAFKYFDPELSEHLEVLFKEVRVPRAEQTHEVVYEPVTKCVFVSQMSNSVLVRIPVCPGGMLLDDQDAWHVGPVGENGDGLGGLHNLSLSAKWPGHLWVSLQFCNEVFLIEAATMKIKHMLKVPTLLVRPDKTAVRVGGPHCIRECGQTGVIWVALKGSIACHPAETPDNAAKGSADSDAPALVKAKQRVCCNPKLLADRMTKLDKLGYNAPPPEGFAIWKVDPKDYDPTAADDAHGGALYECRPSPPMSTIDKNCDCWTAQDVGSAEPCVLKIDSRTGECTQVDVPPPPVCCDVTGKMTGPAIGTAPDGAVWCSLLGGDGAFVRICPDTGARSLYEFESPAWSKKQRIIHFAFHTHYDAWCIFRNQKVVLDKLNIMFAISSNLCDDDALNMVTMYVFYGDSWSEIWGCRCVPLPTQSCSCHRVTVVEDGVPPEDQSVVISELHTSRLFQMKIHNLINFLEIFNEVEYPPDGEPTHSKFDGTPFLRRKYIEAGTTFNSKHCLKEEVNKMMRNRMYRALELALEREDHVMEIAKVPYIDFDAEKECSL